MASVRTESGSFYTAPTSARSMQNLRRMRELSGSQLKNLGPSPHSNESEISGSSGIENLKSRLGLKFFRRSNQPKFASHSELLERLKLFIQISVNLFFRHSPVDCEEEEQFFELLLHFLHGAIKSNFSKENRRSRGWAALLWACREKIRMNFAEFLGASVFSEFLDAKPLPEFLFKRTIAVVQALVYDGAVRELLKYVLENFLPIQICLDLNFHEIFFTDFRLDECRRSEIENLLKALRQIRGNSILAQACVEGIGIIPEGRKLWKFYYWQKFGEINQTLLNLLNKIQNRDSKIAAIVSEIAMKMTCTVVEEQNVPRKLYLQYTKLQSSRKLAAEENWKIIVRDLCHPEAAGFDENSYPSSWGLDPTEGPNRERKRLMPMHLDLPEKFLLPEARKKFSHVQPLQNFILNVRSQKKVAENSQSDSRTLIDEMQINEKIVTTCTATIVTPSAEIKGELLLGASCLVCKTLKISLFAICF